MQNMTIEQLKAQVAAKVEANKKRLEEKVEIATLTAQLALESSEVLFEAKVQQEASASQTRKLQQLVDECAGIVANVPVYNQKTRTNRVWAGSRKFNYGTQIDLMYQLATGILYSCQEHKQLLLAHTGLSLELLQDIVDAFGTPTYYSRNYHSVVEAKPYNVERAKGAVSIMQSDLGVVVDTSAMTSKNFENEFARAEAKAEEDHVLAMVAIEEADFDL